MTTNLTSNNIDATAGSCCDFQASVSRRNAFRIGAGLAGGLAAVSVLGDAFIETAYAATGKADRVLVVLSLRGAADGMSLMVPHGDPVYFAARPSISIPKERLIAADDFFGLHPELAPLLPMWEAGSMAAIHATGQRVTTRSHFSAMEEVEDADPGSSERVGWLNRLLSLNPAGTSLLNGIQLGSTTLATQSYGPTPVLATRGLDAIRVSGPDPNGWLTGMRSLWQDEKNGPVAGGARAFAVADTFAPVIASPKGTGYPAGDLGSALAATARMIRADVGAEVITVDQGSWDHHQNVGNLSGGNLLTMVKPLGAALAAFFKDLGPLADKVTVVTISEFGRRVKENAGRGLDHGHGNVMFVLGGGVKGGYYGRWPGIENTDNADLPVTTDYRDVLAEVVSVLYPERRLSTVFPGLTPARVGFMHSSTSLEGGGDVLPRQPAGFYRSMGTKRGKARVRRRVTAPEPVLSAAGLKAGVAVTYRWETTAGGKVRKRGSNPSAVVRKKWKGSDLKVRITCRAAGYQPLERVVSFGTVRK
ncbi:DUF1501 domain-containing protein [Nocardioides sp. GXZ039]|uniref:DUF1501 domain-containing protein n=1 Tax=Nocardioides sp. GXZ039 TaxID=3136018 RepID=UPI0030F3D123